MTSHNLKTCLLSLLLLGISQLAFSQNDDVEPFRVKNKIDVGLNVTSVLSSFSGNGNLLEPSDLPMLIRFNTKKSTIRLGAGARGSSNDFFDEITQSFRISEEMEFVGKLGIESNILRQKKIDGYIGIDYVGSYKLDKVTVDSPFDNSFIKKSSIGYGLSPFVGIRFYISDRIYLSSEANLFYQITTEKTKQATSTNPDFPILDINREEFAINPPLYLYINYKL